MKEFRKGEVLTARRLNELVAEFEQLSGGLPVPVMAPAARVTGMPGPAWFNDPVSGGDVAGDGEAAAGGSYWSECEGMVYSLDDYMGLIGGAHWMEEARGLRISDGVLLLNGAQDRAAADAGEGVAQVMGGMKRLEFAGGLDRPVIEDGVGRLPYAEANAGRSVAGGLRGVGYRAGLTWPMIEDGELWLPQPAAGEPGEPLVVPTADSESGRYGTVVGIGPADPEGTDDGWAVRDGHIVAGLADTCDGRAGVLCGCSWADVDEPRISRGLLQIPRPSGAAGGLPGLYDAVNNVGVPWSSLQDGAVVRLSYSGGSQLGVSVTTFKGGYLAIMVDKA